MSNLGFRSPNFIISSRPFLASYPPNPTQRHVNKMSPPFSCYRINAATSLSLLSTSLTLSSLTSAHVALREWCDDIVRRWCCELSQSGRRGPLLGSYLIWHFSNTVFEATHYNIFFDFILNIFFDCIINTSITVTIITCSTQQIEKMKLVFTQLRRWERHRAKIYRSCRKTFLSNTN